ncbi:hypothetical protein A4A49_04747 [Nicotiana attenuata]|uniref:Uncharacterized protein n=1 Tax=Nicotiana attenuata TaxID=49451 RepID=A0A1J6IDU1_NICAT|nr:hypothetical protein A4A49_04747 [Nicotiana attenuata]
MLIKPPRADFPLNSKITERAKVFPNCFCSFFWNSLLKSQYNLAAFGYNKENRRSISIISILSVGLLKSYDANYSSFTSYQSRWVLLRVQSFA